MTAMKYGATNTNERAPIKVVAKSLGSASANGDVSLSDTLANYQLIGFAPTLSSVMTGFDMIPVSVFKSSPYYSRFDSNNTYRHIQVDYKNDTTVTISNRSNLNIEIFGINLR